MRAVMAEENVLLLNGDSLQLELVLPENSIDAVVCDPPYELGFMGKRWDATGIAYNVKLWRAVFRALKPGGHLLAFGGTRTYHRMACAIEDAGFEIRDSLHWVYGSGFPKSLNVSKAIDGALGATPIDLGRPKVHGDGKPQHSTSEEARIATGGRCQSGATVHANATAPATEQAAQWDGWGTALKPAHEPIILARKPLDGTVAANVLAHGTGGINVDACRIGRDPGDVSGWSQTGSDESENLSMSGKNYARDAKPDAAGRWPANFVLSHTDECELVGTREARRNVGTALDGGCNREGTVLGDGGLNDHRTVGSTKEQVDEYRCAPGCPVAELDAQSGVSKDGKAINRNRTARAASPAGYAPSKIDPVDVGYGGSGGASRFFYVAKPSTRERDYGCEALPVKSGGEATDREEGSAGLESPRAGAGRKGGRRNVHPTVKPIALMRWLCRLVTPPGGTVLDPFLGSGTTGIAAIREGLNFVGVEREEEYAEIARARLTHALGERKAQ